jgi:hypothetical protein
MKFELLLCGGVGPHEHSAPRLTPGLTSICARHTPHLTSVAPRHTPHVPTLLPSGAPLLTPCQWCWTAWCWSDWCWSGWLCLSLSVF